MPHFVLTANATLDGAAVFLQPGRAWSGQIDGAAVYDGRKTAEDDLAWARTQERSLCDPHLQKVKLNGDEIVLVDRRSRIRSAGPDALLVRLGYLPAPTEEEGGAHVSV